MNTSEERRLPLSSVLFLPNHSLDNKLAHLVLVAWNYSCQVVSLTCMAVVAGMVTDVPRAVMVDPCLTMVTVVVHQLVALEAEHWLLPSQVER